jgi:hypothetical protein
VVPAVVIAGVGVLAGGPGWLVVTLAAAVFVLSLGAGVRESTTRAAATPLSQTPRRVVPPATPPPIAGT